METHFNVHLGVQTAKLNSFVGVFAQVVPQRKSSISQYSAHFPDECRKPRLDHIPYQSVIHVGVFVDQYIAERDDSPQTSCHGRIHLVSPQPSGRRTDI